MSSAYCSEAITGLEDVLSAATDPKENSATTSPDCQKRSFTKLGIRAQNARVAICQNLAKSNEITLFAATVGLF